MILMSNNQWKCDHNCDAWSAIGEDCSAEARVKGLARAYKAVMPDVIGLQEVSLRMAALMMDELDEVALPDGSIARYEYISGGDTPIVYRRDKLMLLESGFFRYDEAVPGLEGSFNNSETKSYCFGVFESRKDGSRFALMSTHLWWMSSHPESPNYRAGSNEARAYQIRLASARMDEVMAKYACPGVLMGDLNASVNSLCLEAARDEGWLEAHDLAPADARDETRGHHPCGPKGFERNDPGTFEQAIDHILIKNAPQAKVKYFRRLTDEWFDKVSDHYPLYIDIEF
ncbi:MAG: endonuclease/exonuclease/phosphatase family protein [Clostridia bacterium]|nr:endonuclease/exonuclease/phosphatase family protein [Clostridia bacterium]